MDFEFDINNAKKVRPSVEKLLMSVVDEGYENIEDHPGFGGLSFTKDIFLKGVKKYRDEDPDFYLEMMDYEDEKDAVKNIVSNVFSTYVRNKINDGSISKSNEIDSIKREAKAIFRGYTRIDDTVDRLKKRLERLNRKLN